MEQSGRRADLIDYVLSAVFVAAVLGAVWSSVIDIAHEYAVLPASTRTQKDRD